MTASTRDGLLRHLAVAGVLLSATAAQAQTKLFVLLTGATGSRCTLTDCEPGYVLEIDVEGRRIVNRTIVTDVREDPSRPAMTPDARYLIWAGRDGPLSRLWFSVFDSVAHSTVLRLPLSTGYGDPGTEVAAHPAAIRAHMIHGNQVRILEPTQDRTFPAACDYPRLLGLSGDGSRLLTMCFTTVPGTARVFDSETGTSLATITRSTPVGALNADGTELFTAEYEGPLELRRYDVATGGVLQSTVIGAAGDFAQQILVDPRTGRLYVSVLTASGGALLVVDGSTLLEAARLPTGLSPHVAFVADAPRAYVASRINDASPRPGTRITVVDTDRLTIEDAVDLPVSSGPAGLVVAPRPLAVESLTGQVRGQQVTLQWIAPPDLYRTAYRVEVGLTPGTVDLSFDLPPNVASYSVAPVPSGSYYVRMRSLNAVTSSTATDPIRVDVP